MPSDPQPIAPLSYAHGRMRSTIRLATLDAMAEHDELPRVQDELEDLRRAQAIVQRNKPSLGANVQGRQATTERIDYWMQSGKPTQRRPWWQFWK